MTIMTTEKLKKIIILLNFIVFGIDIISSMLRSMFTVSKKNPTEETNLFLEARISFDSARLMTETENTKHHKLTKIDDISFFGNDLDKKFCTIIKKKWL